jgi:hypothetical protein
MFGAKASPALPPPPEAEIFSGRLIWIWLVPSLAWKVIVPLKVLVGRLVISPVVELSERPAGITNVVVLPSRTLTSENVTLPAALAVSSGAS